MGIYTALMGAWIRFGTSVFPRTIHPMVLHFPIVLLYLAVLVEVMRYVMGKAHDSFYQRAGFWVLTLSLFAIAGAAATGILSEQYVRFTPQTEAILSAHQRDAVLTGVFAIAAWIVRVFTRFHGERRDRWSLFKTGRGRSTVLSSLLVLAAMIMVSITGSLGGTMVYHYGVGTPSTLKTTTAQAVGGQGK